MGKRRRTCGCRANNVVAFPSSCSSLRARLYAMTTYLTHKLCVARGSSVFIKVVIHPTWDACRLSARLEHDSVAGSFVWTPVLRMEGGEGAIPLRFGDRVLLSPSYDHVRLRAATAVRLSLSLSLGARHFPQERGFLFCTGCGDGGCRGKCFATLRPCCTEWLMWPVWLCVSPAARFEEHSRVRVVRRDADRLVAASAQVSASISLVDCVFEITPPFTYSDETVRNGTYLKEAIQNERDATSLCGKALRYGQTLQLYVASHNTPTHVVGYHIRTHVGFELTVSSHL